MIQTEEEKKSLVITIALFLLLFLMLFFFGLSYLDPSTEQGIAVNFGTSKIGNGKIQPTKTVKTSPNTSTNNIIPTEKSTATQVESSTPSKTADDIVTQKNIDAPVIKASDKTKKQVTTDTKKENATKSTQNNNSKKPLKETPKPVEKKPDASTKNALDSFLNGAKQDGETTRGEGNDTNGGDKGKINGDLKAKSYYGNGKGLDGDGNYRLGGRKALNKERNVPKCNETGIVVVKIEVDRNGKVIGAYPGVKGTTNTAPCLMEPAKKAALATKFNSDSKAPNKQIGSIIYNFKLSE